MSFSLDPPVARIAWREGICFPGLISLAIIAYAVYPDLAGRFAGDAFLLFSYVWLTLSMLAAWGVKRLEGLPVAGRAAPALLYVVGYGPLLCAITANAYLKELQGSEMVWEKTEKTGTVSSDLA